VIISPRTSPSYTNPLPLPVIRDRGSDDRMPQEQHRAMRARIAVPLVIAALALGALCTPLSASAEPGTQVVRVNVSQPSTAVRTGESVPATVTVSLSEPAEYLEVRFRLHSPEGRLVYQKTEVRWDMEAGAHAIGFERSAGATMLTQGRYPIEIRVLASGSDPTTASGRVLVLDPDTAPQPVVLVARVWGTASVGHQSSGATDPATGVALRSDLIALADLAVNARVPVALALPPVLIEEVARTAGGYQAPNGDGIVSEDAGVAPDADTVTEAGDALEALVDANASGALTLLDVPYALPDLTGLAEAGAESDLAAHWALADSVDLAAVRSVMASGTAYLGSSLTRSGITSLDARATPAVVAPGRALRIDGEEPAPGIYTLSNDHLTVIVPDDEVTAAIDAGSDEFYDVLFDRMGSGPATLMIDVGPDARGGVDAVRDAAGWVERADWLRWQPVDGVVAPEDAAVVSIAEGATSAPNGYWDGLAMARSLVRAYSDAVGDDDADVMSASRMLLVAESELWSGPHGTWPRVVRPRDMVTRVEEFVSSEFARVVLDVKDVTLSGSTGEVPFTVVNSTGKHLELTIVVEPLDARGERTTTSVALEPTQNFITVPVDLRNAIASRLRISAVSGDVTVAEATLDVRTSYIDRLATVGMVVLVLIVLLVVIRRHMVPADAGTIGDRASEGRSSDERQ